MTTLYTVQTHYHIQVRMRDGVLLSANLWLPEPRTPAERFPAILEMIPYRKDDWRYAADHQRMTWFAQRGYGCCRLDVRGTGSSGGIALDEYTVSTPWRKRKMAMRWWSGWPRNRGAAAT
jgi:uncharacterized protein